MATSPVTPVPDLTSPTNWRAPVLDPSTGTLEQPETWRFSQQYQRIFLAWWRVLSKVQALANALIGPALVDMTLTANATILVPQTSLSDLVVILRFAGATGFSWGPGFSATSTNIDTTAGTISTFRFVLSQGLWVMVGQPTTGMQP